MALAETADLAVRINLKDNVSRGVGRLQKNLKGLSGAVSQTGRGFGQIGAGLTRAGLVVGGAAITGIVGAAKAAIDFQDAFAGVRKTVDEQELAAAGLTFDDLARSFRGMATEMPIAASDLARIGETAGALGIRAQDIDDFSKTVALLGVTTNLTTEDAAESLGKVGTILGLTGGQFEDFADILVNLGNKGASTEGEIIEITKRFGAAGKAAGLTVPEILAFSSAIASAGVEPEAAGSSLSRLFGNLIKETALATDKGKAFAAITGKSFTDFSKIVETDTTGAMLLFLDSLRGLDKFAQEKALQDIGITNVRDRNAIRLLAMTYEQNLIPALKNAQEAEGALGIEAQKRFDTIASKLKVLQNNFVEAGITVGEAFLPALGRATEKLAAFLKTPEAKNQLTALGQDIGAAIDKIDWNAVLDGATKFYSLLKGALSFAQLMFQAFMALPGPIKEATAGFLVLNKLSGGLIAAGAGNVVGGLAGAAIQGAASRAPGIGRLFAQRVFVTNWPLGFGGGLPGGGKGGIPLAGGAGALAGIGAAPFAALVAGTLAPLVATKLITGITDPTGLRNDQGRIDTARARGVPDWNIPGVGMHGGMSPDARSEQRSAALLGYLAQKAGERAPAPVVNVTTNVSVSATNVVHKYVQIRRSGPTGGSRERSGPLEF